MKLGEFFIALGIKGNTKELDKTDKQMQQLEKHSKSLEEKNKKLTVSTDNFSKSLRANMQAMRRMALAVVGTIGMLDRMANAFYRANQQAITFSRTTGVGLGTLNKYASASSMVNYNATREGMAGSLSNVAGNLLDIQMGRGDVSPYQELAFFGGKAINPYGKSVEQIVEEVREAIKGVDDIKAVNILQRMGFSADDLMMLRMTKEEMAEVNNLFLSPEQQEKAYKLGLELKKIHLQLQKTGQEILIKILPTLNQLGQHVVMIVEQFSKVPQLIDSLKVALIGLGVALTVANPGLMAFIAGMTALFLILDDVAGYYAGKNSVLGLAIEGIKQFGEAIQDSLPKFKGIEEPMKALANWNFLAGGLNVKSISDAIIKGLTEDIHGKIPTIPDLIRGVDNTVNPTNSTVNQNNNVTINTTERADKAVGNNIVSQFSSIIPQQRAYV
jgi:phosphate uptake regulator